MSGARNLRVDGVRLVARLKALGAVGALPGGGVCRLALSPEDKAGRDLVVGWMKDLGLAVRIDRLGNIVGTRAGTADGPPVMIGSHIDTVRTGGLYDGNLGVLAGLEVIATLNDAGIVTASPLAVAAFTNEEGSRFQPDMMGSLAFVGGLDLETALATRGIDGATVGDCLDAIGYAGDAPLGAAANSAKAYVELHIEQGPVLDAEGVAIGAVEQVQGISWTEFSFTGVSNHAGTTPMRMRHDAGFVAAAVAVEARRIAKEIGGDQVATVGYWEIGPNLVNVVPNAVTITVDLRNTDEGKLQEAEAMLHGFVAATAAAEGVAVSHRSLARFAPVPFSPVVIDRVAANAAALGLSLKRMPSGAGHDAQMLARICPAGMIFVPSQGGISHNVTEYTDPAEIAAGANVLLHTVLDLASGEVELKE